MKKNLLNTYVTNHLKSIEHHLYAYTKDQKPKHLHQLRVDIKKINAICTFANSVYTVKHHAEILRPLFRKAGKIREIQIYIRQLTAFPHKPVRLILRLKQKENTLIRKFITVSNRYLMLLNKFKSKICFPENLPAKNIITKYFKKEKLKADKKLLRKDKKNLHQYRIKLKKMMYVYHAMNKNLQNEVDLNPAEIKKIQKKLGDWHDIYSTVHFLARAHIPKKARKHALKMKKKEKRLAKTFY